MRMRKFDKIMLALICSLIFLAIVIISKVFDLPWDWGSFAGGLVGGIGTLIAVYITTIETRKVQQENKRQHDTDIENEKEKIIIENALIVYYDLLFALEDLKSFAKVFLKNKNKENFIANKHLISNTYFATDWIHAVAKTSPAVDSETTHLIYNLYGNLNAVLSYIKRPDDEISDDEANFVAEIIVKNFYANENGQFKLKSNIYDLFGVLRRKVNKQKDFNATGNDIEDIKEFILE